MSALQYAVEPLDEILIGLKIIEYENKRDDKQQKRAEQASKLPPS